MERDILRKWSQIQELHDQQNEVEDVHIVSPKVCVLPSYETIDENTHNRFQQEEGEGRYTNCTQDCRLYLGGFQLGSEVGQSSTD